MVLKSYPVPADFLNLTVDFVLSRFTGINSVESAELIESGKVFLDGIPVADPAQKILRECVLELILPDSALPEKQYKTVSGMKILFEDADIIVVDKPADMAAHASLNFTGANVLETLLAAGVRLTASGPSEQKGIVHRLDAGTSGCMVLAKSEQAYSGLKRAFKERTVTKIYHALAQGLPDPLSGSIEMPIAQDRRYQWKMGIFKNGKYALTHYDVIEVTPQAALCEIHLETGRTHQIRVHLAAIGHPCVGDQLYGADRQQSVWLGLERQWLHAVRLGFVHPVIGNYLEFESAYPKDLQDALDILRAEVN